jgi:hypothetical protein
MRIENAVIIDRNNQELIFVIVAHIKNTIIRNFNLLNFKKTYKIICNK